MKYTIAVTMYADIYIDPDVLVTEDPDTYAYFGDEGEPDEVSRLAHILWDREVLGNRHIEGWTEEQSNEIRVEITEIGDVDILSVEHAEK